MAHLLPDDTARGLDGLPVDEPKLRSTRLHWMVTGPVRASPNSVKDGVEKLLFLRGLGANAVDLSAPPAERRRFLAQIRRRLTAQALVRREPNQRHPILLTLLAQSTVDALDSVVQLFDQTLSARRRALGWSCVTSSPSGAKLSEVRLALLESSCPGSRTPVSRTRR